MAGAGSGRVRWWAIGGIVFVIALVAGGIAWQRMDPPFDPEPPLPVSAEARDWADTTFGAFDAVTVSGTGEDIIDFPALPADVTAVLVELTAGDGPFRISELYGAAGEEKTVLDGPGTLLEGPLQHRAIYEPHHPGWDASALQIYTESEWTLTFSPVSAAGGLSTPMVGVGADVLIYDGSARPITFSHSDDDGYYAVFIGSWEGPEELDDYGWLNTADIVTHGKGEAESRIELPAGPALVVISSGAWRLG